MRWIAAIAAAIGLAIGLPQLLAWQRSQEQASQSVGNIRRVAVALLSYAQDWDDRLPPIAVRRESGSWTTWTEAVAGYESARSSFVDPASPVPLSGPACTNPIDHYAVRTSFALNRRFWNTFGPGPFPVGNVELPEQTALLVDAGPLSREPREPASRASDRSRFAFLDYGDTTDRYDGLFRYPSPHSGLMTVIGVDCHTVSRRVAHYYPSDGPHDLLYGLLVPGIYNWNGGHPNGQTDRPRRQ